MQRVNISQLEIASSKSVSFVSPGRLVKVRQGAKGRAKLGALHEDGKGGPAR